MKTATKIFIILGMIPGVFGTRYIKVNLGEGVSDSVRNIVSLILLAISVVSFAISLTFGIMALVKLGKAKCKVDVPVWLSVCVLLFVNIIGGILMLCLKDEHFMPKELVEFKKLLDDGIITQEEYDAKAAQLSK